SRRECRQLHSLRVPSRRERRGDERADRSAAPVPSARMSFAAAASRRLADLDPGLERLLREGALPTPQFAASAIACRTVYVPWRAGPRWPPDLSLPPRVPAPVVIVRTPYGRDWEAYGQAAAMLALARRGYAVVSQDCRGTGDSEPDTWDYF